MLSSEPLLSAEVEVPCKALGTPIPSSLNLQNTPSYLMQEGCCTPAEAVATVEAWGEASQGQEIFQAVSELLVGDKTRRVVAESRGRIFCIHLVHQHYHVPEQVQGWIVIGWDGDDQVSLAELDRFTKCHMYEHYLAASIQGDVRPGQRQSGVKLDGFRDNIGFSEESIKTGQEATP